MNTTLTVPNLPGGRQALTDSAPEVAADHDVSLVVGSGCIWLEGDVDDVFAVVEKTRADRN